MQGGILGLEGARIRDKGLQRMGSERTRDPAAHSRVKFTFCPLRVRQKFLKLPSYSPGSNGQHALLFQAWPIRIYLFCFWRQDLMWSNYREDDLGLRILLPPLPNAGFTGMSNTPGLYSSEDWTQSLVHVGRSRTHPLSYISQPLLAPEMTQHIILYKGPLTGPFPKQDWMETNL